MANLWHKFKVWLKERVALPFLEYLRQDTEAAVLSRSATLGLILGLCPIVGVSAALCILACFLFRSYLHAPMALLFNFVAVPLELLLIVPFMRFGEFVLRAPPVHVIPKHFSDITHPGEALRGLGHAVLGWAIISAVIFWPIATLLTPFFSYLKRRFGSLRRTGSELDDGEGPLMEGLAQDNSQSADSDLELANGGPTTPTASLSGQQQRGSTLSPRSNSAQINGSKFNSYV